jgi:uncharacterized membrane protein YccF (DUF307 family)
MGVIATRPAGGAWWSPRMGGDGEIHLRTLGNILWHFPFLGFITAAFYWLLGLLLTLLVVTAPLGLGLMEFGKFLLAPFGVVFVIVNALQVFALCLSIVGIPVALVIAKSLGTVFNPVNKVCVPSEVAEEMARRNAHAEIDRHRG